MAFDAQQLLKDSIAAALAEVKDSAQDTKNFLAEVARQYGNDGVRYASAFSRSLITRQTFDYLIDDTKMFMQADLEVAKILGKPSIGKATQAFVRVITDAATGAAASALGPAGSVVVNAVIDATRDSRSRGKPAGNH